MVELSCIFTILLSQYLMTTSQIQRFHTLLVANSSHNAYVFWMNVHEICLSKSHCHHESHNLVTKSLCKFPPLYNKAGVAFPFFLFINKYAGEKKLRCPQHASVIIECHTYSLGKLWYVQYFHKNHRNDFQPQANNLPSSLKSHLPSFGVTGPSSIFIGFEPGEPGVSLVQRWDK